MSSEGKFSQFEILRKIARGGMGEVFLARQTGIEGFAKEVVLKRIHSEYADDPEFVKMFLQEARIAALLDHPNIVQIYELGKHERHYFIVMEYVPGLSLSRLLKVARGPVPLQFVFQVMLGLAEGLSFAHEKTDSDGRPLNLVHRDISPPNILLSTSGAVKITDFGIAKIKESVTQTRAGVIKGKYAYISPEQARGGDADRRSDVYSLGLVLYELTTGNRAYRGTDVEVLQAVSTSSYPAPEGFVPNYPDDLSAILERALALDPADRYQECQDLTDDLLSVQMDRRLATSPAKLGQYVQGMVERYEQARAEKKEARTIREPISSNAFSPVSGSLKDLPTVLLDRISSHTGRTGPIQVDFSPAEPATDHVTVEYDPTAQDPPSQRTGSLTAAAGELVSGRRRSRHLLPWIVLGAGLLVAGAVVAWIIARPPPPAETEVVVVTAAAGGDASPSPKRLPELPRDVRAGPDETPAAPPPAAEPDASATPPAAAPRKERRRSAVRRGRARHARRRSSQRRITATTRKAEPAIENGVSLTLATDPPADAYLGGRRLGRTPLTAKVPPGKLSVTLRNVKLGLRARRTIDTGRGGNLALRLVIKRDATIGFKVPAGRHIQLDGKLLGRSPRPPVKVYEGVHTILVVDPAAGKREKLKLRVRSGQTAWVKVR